MADNFTTLPDCHPNGQHQPNDNGLLYNTLLSQLGTDRGATAQFALQNWKPKHYTASDLAALGAGSDNPTDGMSALERVKAGMGQGIAGADLNVAQFFAENPTIAQMAGYGHMASPAMLKLILQAQREKQQTDAPLMATGAGKAGSAIGETALLAPFVP